MALLKYIYRLLILFAAGSGLCSCYEDFDPNLPSTPVLCMNSEITPDNEIILFLTHTWRWNELNAIDNGHFTRELEVTDAEVDLYVNGKFRERLVPSLYVTAEDYSSIYPSERSCYKSTYRPESGDTLRLEARSEQYGEASAEVLVPFRIPIDRIERRITRMEVYGDIGKFPVSDETVSFSIDFNLKIYFTDPGDRTDFYDLQGSHTPYSNYGGAATAYGYYYPDFSEEPLFTEHLSVLDSAISDTSGYTIFTDRQINGKTYPLRLSFLNSEFTYKNPSDLPGPKEAGIVITLRHIDETYYKHVLSLWEGNDAIVGSLGSVGLANPVYPYSNVSTRAGVVTAYAESNVTLSMVEIIEEYLNK